MSLTVGTPNWASANSSGLERAEHGGLADQSLIPTPVRSTHPLDHGIRLRMHGGRVERVVAVRDSEEAGRLLERALAEARHVEELLRLRNAPCSSRNETMFFASVAFRPEIRDSSGADAVLTSAPTALTQSSTTASSCRASRTD